jgi:hypothetical protein
VKRIAKTFAISLAFTTCLTLPANAQTDDNSGLASMQQQIAEQKRQIKEQQAQLARQQKILEAQEVRFNRLQKQIEILSARSSQQAAPARSAVRSSASTLTGTPRKIASIPQQDAHPEVGMEQKDQQEKTPDITVLDSTTGVLLPKGKFVLEPGLEYSNSSAIRTAIEGFTIVPALTIGAFQISEVNRDTLTARLTGRLGITNRLEADVSVPYLYRRDETRSRPFGVGATEETLTRVTGHDLGDIEAGLHYQLNQGRQGWPVLIANGRFKSVTGTGPFEVPTDPVTGLQRELPTGSGFYSVQSSLTAIVPSDPVILFGNLGYSMNFERDTPLGDIDPGDSISGSAGMSLLLNDKLSLSMSYNHDMVLQTDLNGSRLPGSTILQIGSLNLGSSYKLYDNMSLNFIVSVGVTENAPDIRLLVKTPISFDF